MNRYEEEIAINREVWRSKPLLRDVYALLYKRMERCIDRSLTGRIVEIGSGIGNFGEFVEHVILTDQSIQPWLDLCCDAYRLPLRSGTVSHLVLFDVFHHLSAPAEFFREAARVMTEGGRVIILDPFISATSALVYGLWHPERIGWHAPIESTPSGKYYAAQGNATRLLFRDVGWLEGWRVMYREAFSASAYLLSGGFSGPALYPRKLLPLLTVVDGALSRLPRLFGARCLVVLTRTAA